MNSYEKQYMNIVSKIVKEGYYDQNRTGVATYKIPHQIMQFDLSKEFPILQSKRVAFKTAVKELLWIYKDQSNDVTKLQEQNVHIWDEWVDEANTIGKAYGYAISPTARIMEVVPIERRLAVPNSDIKVRFFDLVKPEYIDDDDKIGQTLKNIYGEEFIIIKYKKTNEHYVKYYDIQFLKTGYIAKDKSWSNISRGQVKDIYARNNVGIGYIGEKDYKNISKELERKLLVVWGSMLERCYNESKSNYKDYGARGIFVHDRWHSFTNFVKDVRTLPNWSAKIKDWSKYQLDKDYYGSNCYSKNTCVWLHNSDNALYSGKKGKLFKAYNNGFSKLYISPTQCASELGVDHSAIQRVLRGKYKQHKGYSFEYVNHSENVLYRYKLPTNQLNKLIDTLKNNPQDRRMIMNMWTVNDLAEMELQPCCFQTIFDVSDGKLNCMLIQRSADFPLGNPFNVSQYAVLVRIISQVTGLKPGIFTHIVNNAHIYENQLEGMKEQQYRYDLMKYVQEKLDLLKSLEKLDVVDECYQNLIEKINKELEEDEELKEIKEVLLSTPKLELNPDIKDFYDFTIDDINIVDYKCLKTIKMPVSV